MDGKVLTSSSSHKAHMDGKVLTKGKEILAYTLIRQKKKKLYCPIPTDPKIRKSRVAFFFSFFFFNFKNLVFKENEPDDCIFVVS
jgi:hypothetical protein